MILQVGIQEQTNSKPIKTQPMRGRLNKNTPRIHCTANVCQSLASELRLFVQECCSVPGEAVFHRFRLLTGPASTLPWGPGTLPQPKGFPPARQLQAGIVVVVWGVWWASTRPVWVRLRLASQTGIPMRCFFFFTVFRPLRRRTSSSSESSISSSAEKRIWQTVKTKTLRIEGLHGTHIPPYIYIR